MTKTSEPYVLLVDINAPWVRSLLSALPGVLAGQQHLRAWRVHSLSYWLRSAGWRADSASCDAGPRITERTALLPGWRAAERFSTAILVAIVRRTLRTLGTPDAIVYTLPQYAGVAERFSSFRQAYYAYDPYEFYHGWDGRRVKALEKRMLKACTVAFAVSRQLVDDLQKLGETPVHYSPNAVSQSFLDALSKPAGLVPAELAQIKGKIVGCIGQLHPEAYDWDLIEALAEAFPAAGFVFIGSKMQAGGAAAARMAKVLTLPNVRWLGPKPHSELPQYLKGFDVCLNPLAVTDHNHRRSFLRLYDYLATDKPILSTAVREAGEHEGTVCIGHDLRECKEVLASMLNGSCETPMDHRRRYISRNTWEQRAQALWSRIVESPGAPFLRS